ncbi:MAG: zinc ribbon domain-containing protein [Candidatus Rifleibacteriota bacterium]
MPLYEFVCSECRKKFNVLCKIDERDTTKECPKCGKFKTRRLVSRFKTVRSEEQIMESLADPTNLSGIDENDPKSMAAWAKKMAREMGENMDDEIDALAEEEFGGADDTIGASSDYSSDDDQL